ncbi:hypothetical protein Q7P35_002446 [Cladosporium inversicolor]
MSTDILTRDSISGEAPLSCRDTFGLWGRTPMKWQNSESSNFTDYNCAVPSCNNYPSVLASCCSSYVEDLHQFNTTVGPLFSCALDEAKTEETYQEYQNCLLRHLVDPFKCNDPGPDTPTVDGCDGQVIEPPQSPGLDEQICSMRASSNATRALVSCCSGAGTNGTGIISLDSGCNVACISDSAEMQDCLSETLSNPTQGGAITCHTGKGLEGSQDSAENTSQSTYVGVQVMLVGGAGLLAVSLLLPGANEKVCEPIEPDSAIKSELHSACKSQDSKRVRELLDNGSTTAADATACLLETWQDLSLMRLLLEHGADPAACASRYYIKKSFDLVKVLMENYTNSREQIDWLLDHGVDIGQTDAERIDSGQRSGQCHDLSLKHLNIVAASGNIPFFDHLVARGVDPHRSMALHCASKRKGPAKTTAMIEHLLDVHHMNIEANNRDLRKFIHASGDSGTPLVYAVYYQNLTASFYNAHC